MEHMDYLTANQQEDLTICSRCGKTFKTKRALQIHISSMHNTNDICPECDAHVIAGMTMFRHRAREHGVVYKCTLCSYITNSQHSLDNHHRLCHAEKVLPAYPFRNTAQTKSGIGYMVKTEKTVVLEVPEGYQFEKIRSDTFSLIQEWKCTLCPITCFSVPALLQPGHLLEVKYYGNILHQHLPQSENVFAQLSDADQPKVIHKEDGKDLQVAFDMQIYERIEHRRLVMTNQTAIYELFNCVVTDCNVSIYRNLATGTFVLPSCVLIHEQHKKLETYNWQLGLKIQDVVRPTVAVNPDNCLLPTGNSVYGLDVHFPFTNTGESFDSLVTDFLRHTNKLQEIDRRIYTKRDLLVALTNYFVSLRNAGESRPWELFLKQCHRMTELEEDYIITSPVADCFPYMAACIRLNNEILQINANADGWKSICKNAPRCWNYAEENGLCNMDQQSGFLTVGLYMDMSRTDKAVFMPINCLSLYGICISETGSLRRWFQDGRPKYKHIEELKPIFCFKVTGQGYYQTGRRLYASISFSVWIMTMFYHVQMKENDKAIKLLLKNNIPQFRLDRQIVDIIFHLNNFKLTLNSLEMEIHKAQQIVSEDPNKIEKQIKRIKQFVQLWKDAKEGKRNGVPILELSNEENRTKPSVYLCYILAIYYAGSKTFDKKMAIRPGTAGYHSMGDLHYDLSSLGMAKRELELEPCGRPLFAYDDGDDELIEIDESLTILAFVMAELCQVKMAQAEFLALQTVKCANLVFPISKIRLFEELDRLETIALHILDLLPGHRFNWPWKSGEIPSFKFPSEFYRKEWNVGDVGADSNDLDDIIDSLMEGESEREGEDSFD